MMGEAAGAGEGNRTLVVSLGKHRLPVTAETIELFSRTSNTEQKEIKERKRGVYTALAPHRFQGLL